MVVLFCSSNGSELLYKLIIDTYLLAWLLSLLKWVVTFGDIWLVDLAIDARGDIRYVQAASYPG